jgi:hypothetical protein
VDLENDMANLQLFKLLPTATLVARRLDLKLALRDAVYVRYR